MKNSLGTNLGCRDGGMAVPDRGARPTRHVSPLGLLLGKSQTALILYLIINVYR